MMAMCTSGHHVVRLPSKTTARARRASPVSRFSGGDTAVRRTTTKVVATACDSSSSANMAKSIQDILTSAKAALERMEGEWYKPRSGAHARSRRCQLNSPLISLPGWLPQLLTRRYLAKFSAVHNATNLEQVVLAKEFLKLPALLLALRYNAPPRSETTKHVAYKSIRTSI